jgi:hypothetical protein
MPSSTETTQAYQKKMDEACARIVGEFKLLQDEGFDKFDICTLVSGVITTMSEEDKTGEWAAGFMRLYKDYMEPGLALRAMLFLLHKLGGKLDGKSSPGA